MLSQLFPHLPHLSTNQLLYVLSVSLSLFVCERVCVCERDNKREITKLIIIKRNNKNRCRAGEALEPELLTTILRCSKIRREHSILEQGGH